MALICLQFAAVAASVLHLHISPGAQDYDADLERSKITNGFGFPLAQRCWRAGGLCLSFKA